MQKPQPTKSSELEINHDLYGVEAEAGSRNESEKTISAVEW